MTSAAREPGWTAPPEDHLAWLADEIDRQIASSRALETLTGTCLTRLLALRGPHTAPAAEVLTELYALQARFAEFRETAEVLTAALGQAAGAAVYQRAACLDAYQDGIAEGERRAAARAARGRRARQGQNTLKIAGTAVPGAVTPPRPLLTARAHKAG